MNDLRADHFQVPSSMFTSIKNTKTFILTLKKCVTTITLPLVSHVFYFLFYQDELSTFIVAKHSFHHFIPMKCIIVFQTELFFTIRFRLILLLVSDIFLINNFTFIPFGFQSFLMAVAITSIFSIHSYNS